MIKNKYYIGQRVRYIPANKEFVISAIALCKNTIEYRGKSSGENLIIYSSEYELEPLPEKQKIVLYKWYFKTSSGDWYKEEATEGYAVETDSCFRGEKVEEVEMP